MFQNLLFVFSPVSSGQQSVTPTFAESKCCKSDGEFKHVSTPICPRSRKADSVLNHTLKNTMAEAADGLDGLMEEPQCSDRQAQTLKTCVASLRRGMRACRHRQAYIHMASDNYVLSVQPLRLAGFVADLTAGRRMASSVSASSAVLLDPTLCGLVLDNAISNAFRHGHPEDPEVRLVVTTTEIEERVQLTFLLTNRTNPSRPTVTPEYIDAVLSGKSRKAGASTSAMSDQIGLQHAFLAADLHNMKTSLVQVGTRVEFKALVDVAVAPDVQDSHDDLYAVDLAKFPSGICIHAIDDSAATRQLLKHNLLLRATPNVHMYGETRTEVAQFISGAAADADLVILDQHLEYGGTDNVLGTELIPQLLARSFAGFICMRSGNVSSDDVAMYLEAGAHCVFGKEIPLKQMIDDMKVAYVRHSQEQADTASTTTTCVASSSVAEEHHPVPCGTSAAGASYVLGPSAFQRPVRSWC